MIRWVDVSKRFTTEKGKTLSALHAISLEVKEGEIFGVMGKSGAGKSTLLRTVNLLERPTSGEVWVADKDLMTLTPEALRAHRHHAGMIFQHFNLLSRRTVFDNVAFSLEVAGVDRADISDRVTELLALVDMTDKAKAYPNQLSGGQKQRTAIARALAYEPKILLCDEATSALDPHATNAILQLLKSINQRLGITILLITHELSVAKACCDRVALLEAGKLVEVAEVAEFFVHPKTDAARAFVEAEFPVEVEPLLGSQLFSEDHPDRFPVFRFSFLGETSRRPIMAALSEEFGVTLNILQGVIEQVGKTMVGTLIVKCERDRSQLDSALAFLQDEGVVVEVLGYV